MSLQAEIAACRICADYLPHGVRPVVSFSATARFLIIGQAPGSKVHDSGIPWDDASGDRLREWTGLTKEQMYDPALVALVPMGFCYPGKASGGDKPPRPECAPQWHERVLATLPKDHLTLLVGSYAQSHYLAKSKKRTMTETVQHFAEYDPIIPLPHPAWRVRMWMGKNPWFAEELLPFLREKITQAF